MIATVLPRAMPRFAAIDVGSNALRLRIVESQVPPPPHSSPENFSAEAPPSGLERPIHWKELENQRAPVRLGSDVFATGRLSPTSIGQACASLRQFRDVMDAHKVEAYRAAATSAVREASNGATLAERARREAGLDLEIIEGIEEARLIQLAVKRRLFLTGKRALLVDVGGGSTELTVLENDNTTYSVSLPLGTVRLLEAYLRNTRRDEQRNLLEEAVDRSLDEAIPRLGARPFDVLIGTGGNIDTLASLCGHPKGYGGYARSVDVTAGRVLYRTLVALTPAERATQFNLRPDRADTIVPASAIFFRIAELFRTNAIVAPGVGLKEGVLEELVAKHFHVWDTASEAENIMETCRRLGQRYQFDEAHGVLVARFAARLFDDLQAVHAFSERDRVLLRAAALLHDIGDFVRYDAHHKHSYYLILHSDIMGLSPEERAIVANIARYHRKSLPDPSHSNFRELDRDARGKVRGLSAILRIADALDREHRGKIQDVRAYVDRLQRTLTLHLEGEQDRELEEWTARAKSELLREVFDLDLQMAPHRGSR